MGKSKEAVIGKPKRKKILREISAILFWSYVITNTFLMDVDSWLISVAPQGLRWLIRYKFVIFLFVIAVAFWFHKGKSIFLNISFLLSYPATRPLRLIWREMKKNSWGTFLGLIVAGMLMLAPIVRSFFLKFRQRVAATSMLALAMALIFINPNPALNIFSIFLILLSLAILAWIKIYTVFFSKRILEGTKFENPETASDAKLWETYEKQHTELIALPAGSAEYTTKRRNNLHQLLRFHKMIEWFRVKQEQILKRGVLVLIEIGYFLAICVVIIFAFGIIYQALYQANPLFFVSGHTQPDFFLFLLFSLAQLSGRTVAGLTSGSNMILAINLFELFILAVMTTTLFLVVLETAFKKRYEQEFGSIITFLHTLTDATEAKFHSLYEISATDAARELKLEGAAIEAYFVDLPDSSTGGASNPSDKK